MKTSYSMLIGLAVTFASVCQAADTDIAHRLQPGETVIPSYTNAYHPDQGQRYLVNDQHRLPAGMVVQGDTVILTIDPDALDGLDGSEVKTTWSLKMACGESKLIADASNPLKAQFRADGYGVNRIVVDITDGKSKRQLKTEVYCEFSTGTAIETLKQDIRMPKGYESNPHVEKPRARFVGHRESMICRNPKTERLVMVWWAKLDHPKSGPLGARWTALVAMISNDHGLTWRDAQIVFHQSMNRTGWGSIVWNPRGNEGQGEFLLWTATNVHEGNKKPNEMLLFRSRDNADSWDLAGNHTETIRKEFGRPSLRSTYFGGNRMVATSKGTIVAAMVCDQHARAVWSDDNGATWNNSNIDNSFPKGNENALVETVDGNRLIFFARPNAGEGRRRYESTDGGKTWHSKADSTVPATRVNFGLGRLDEPDSKWHGRIIHTASTLHNGRHDRYRLVVSINSDVKGVSEKHWNSRILLNYAASYSDVQYLPEDKSIYVIVETCPFGEEYTGKWVWGDTPICRYFKFSPRYFDHLPRYDPDEQMPESAFVPKASSRARPATPPVKTEPATDGSSATTVSFETASAGRFDKLETRIGTWLPLDGTTIIDNKHARTGKQCLQLTGGKKTSVSLKVADGIDTSGVLTFRAERWTKRTPFSFRIEKRTSTGWTEIFNGDKEVRVGRGFLSHVTVPLGDASIEQLRFTVTSPPNTGILIDDIRIGPATDTGDVLDRRIIFQQRDIPEGVPREGHAKDATRYGYRIPSLLVTKKGSILAFSERRLGLHDHAQNDIVLKRSTDGGKTWSDEIVSYEDGMNSINDPLTVQLENGRILLMFARFPYGRHARDAGWIKMADHGYDDPKANVLTFVCHSDDDGLTWSKPVDISRQVKHASLLNANTPGAMIQLTNGPHKGRVVTGLWGTLPIMKDGRRSREWRIVVAYSDDNGQSWKRTEPLEDKSGIGFPNECQVAESSNGDIVLISRNQGGERFRKKAISRDAGQTWSPLNIDPTLPSVACMGSVIKGPLKEDGTWDLWASFPSNAGRKDGQIAVSKDNGRSWRTVKVIPGRFAYSALQVSPDQKSLLCLYEDNGYRTETLITIPFDQLGESVASIEGTPSASKSTPVFQADVDRAGKHQYTNYREPVVVRTVSGRIIVAVHAGNKQGWPERSGQDLVIRYSDDQGASWSPLIVAAEHGNYSVQSHGMVYDAKRNRLIALYVTYNWDFAAVKGRGYAATAPLYEQMHKEGKAAMSAYLVVSDDEGKSWSKPRDITEMVGGDAHFGSSEGRQLKVGKHAGRLILAGGDDRAMDAKGKVTRKKSGVWVSDDHGETWSFQEIKTPEAITSVRNISCEGRVSELPDGTLIHNLRTRNSGRQIAFSRDGGNSWTETVTASEMIAAQCNGSMITVTDKAGKLTQTLLCSLPRGKGRSNGVIYISKDGGKTWPQYKLIVPAAFAYSALVQLDSEHIGVFYETNHHQDIRFIAIPLEQLTNTKRK